MTIELINQYGEKRTVYPLDRDILIPHPFNLNDTLQHLDGQINCAIPYDPEIHKFLVENTFLKSKVYNEESQTIFTGVVKDGLEWIDNGTPEPLSEISLTLQDNGYYLNNTPEEDITYINLSLTTILADICKRCNLQIGSNLPTDKISVAQIKQNTTYLNFINDILFQHCYAFGFDANGVLQTINIKEMETSEVFDDFFTGLKFTKTTKNYNAIHLNYGELTVKQNEQVYYEGGEIASDNTIQPIIIQPNAYYPPEATPIIEEQAGKVIQNFLDGFAQTITLFNGEKKYQRSKNTELIYTEDHVVTKDYSDNLTLDRTDFTATSASVRFYNNSATDAELYQLAIRATAYYRRPKKLILGEGKKFEYEAIYIYDSQRASTFANFLAKYFLGGNYKIAARTEKNFLPGTKLTLKTGISGIATRAIVISSTYNPREKNYNITFLTEADLVLSPKFYQDRHTSQFPGPKGDKGDTGTQGPKGDTGSQGPKGDKGDSGIGIKSITEYYLATKSSSGITNATDGFTPAMQSLTSENKYLWNYELITYTDLTTSKTNAVIIGVYGDEGQAGATGKGVKSITEYYLATEASSGITNSTSGFTEAVQTLTSSKKYLWNYEKIIYTDNSETKTNAVIIGVYGDKGDIGPQGAKGDTGATGATGTRGSLEFSGIEIYSFVVSDVAYTITTASTGITSTSMPIYIGDTYVHTVSQDVWVCVKDGTPTTALWRHQGRRVSDKDDSNLFRLFSVDSPYVSSSSGSENEIVEGTNPFGVKSKLIKLSNKNGRIYSRSIPYEKKIPINSGKSYRYVAYIKKNDTIYNDYFGTRNTSDSTKSEISLLDGSVTNNGYHVSGAFGPLEDWYLVVGYVMASDKTEAPLDSGVYNCSSKKKIKSCKNFKWVQGITSFFHYGTQLRFADAAHSGEETESVCYLYDIRFDEMNGSEPSLTELLYGQQYDTLTLESLEQGGGTIGQLGLYQGQLYKWNGTSWDLTEGVLPTDPVLHYSFDELPDLPDGENFFSQFAYNYNCTIGDTGDVYKIKKTDLTLPSFYCGFKSKVDLKNKVAIFDYRTVTENSPGSLYSDELNSSISTWFDENLSGGWIRRICYFSSENSFTSFRFASIRNVEEIELKNIYIGDGSYSSPLIDNAGKNNADVNGVVVKGVSGKGYRTLTQGGIVAKPPFSWDTQFEYTVSTWIKRYDTTVIIANNWDRHQISTCLLTLRDYSENQGFSMVDVYTKEDKVNRYFAQLELPPKGEWFYYTAVVKDGTAVVYINGKKQNFKFEYESVGFNKNTPNLLQIGKYYSATGYKTYDTEFDDFQIFDRALSEQEVLGLYLARGNTPKQYTLSDYKFDNQPKYYGLATSSAPGNPVKESWFTAGESFGSFIKGHAYKWNGFTWVELDTSNPEDYNLYMTALSDILSTSTELQNVTFLNVFAKALIANQALVKDLQSQVITLTQALDTQGKPIAGTGVIQSSNYLSTGGKEGWQIKADGTADFKTGEFENIVINKENSMYGALVLKEGDVIEIDSLNKYTRGLCSDNFSYENKKGFNLYTIGGTGRVRAEFLDIIGIRSINDNRVIRCDDNFVSMFLSKSSETVIFGEYYKGASASSRINTLYRVVEYFKDERFTTSISHMYLGAKVFLYDKGNVVSEKDNIGIYYDKDGDYVNVYSYSPVNSKGTLPNGTGIIGNAYWSSELIAKVSRTSITSDIVSNVNGIAIFL